MLTNNFYKIDAICRKNVYTYMSSTVALNYDKIETYLKSLSVGGGGENKVKFNFLVTKNNACYYSSGNRATYGFPSAIIDYAWNVSNDNIEGYTSCSDIIANHNLDSCIILPGVSTAEPTVDDYFIPEEDDKIPLLFCYTYLANSNCKLPYSHIPMTYSYTYINKTAKPVTINCQYLITSFINAYSSSESTSFRNYFLLDHTKFDKPKIVQPGDYLTLSYQLGRFIPEDE